MKIGLQVDLFNAKMIMVPENEYDKAKELITVYLVNIKEEELEVSKEQYLLTDKLRMVIEALLFTWSVPEKKNYITEK